MISNFSSFVEFFSAIYVTMAVNNDFCSNFWTPKYYKEMEQLLQTYNFSGSSFIHDKLMEEIKQKYELVQKHAHFRGFILLVLCVYYLVFMGFENESQTIDYYVPFLYSTLFVGITLLFSGKLLANWRCTVLLVLFYAIVNFVLKIACWDALSEFSLTLFLYTYKAQIMIGIIVLPVVYQMYIYWLHSSIYKGYLKTHVSREYERYRRSMDGIKAKDKTKVDKIYLDAWTDVAFSSNADPTLTSFYQVLNKQLLIIASPSYKQLIFSWISFHFNKFIHRKNKSHKNTIINNIEVPLFSRSLQEEKNINTTLDFTKEYERYCLWRKNAGKNNNIKAFCSEQKLSYKDMCAWLRVNKPDKR